MPDALFGQAWVRVLRAPKESPCRICASPTDKRVSFAPGNALAICASCRGHTPAPSSAADHPADMD